MKTIFRSITFSLLLIAYNFCAHAQTAPTIKIGFLTTNIVEITWPTNYTGWQLYSTTNLKSSNNWQLVSAPIVSFGTSLGSFYTLDSTRRFFRLEQGSSCVFHATPSSIAAGGSSVLSWCPVAGTSYQLFPGPGTVTGGTYTVSPTTTTTYTLLASNISGFTPSFTTVTVTTNSGGGCPFANVTNWTCTVDWSYELTTSSSEYSFNIRQQAHMTFFLTNAFRISGAAEYTGYASGNAQINDEVIEIGTPSTITTLVGNGAPQPDPNDARPSRLTLDIDCNTGTYSFTITPEIYATLTQSSGSSSGLFAVGDVTVSHRALPASVGTVGSSEFLNARGPFWTGGGNFYHPGGLADGMFSTGTVTDTTAGSASVDWTFIPSP